MNGVYHIGLTVADLARSMHFYGDVLQLPFRGRLTMSGAASDRLFGRAGVTAELAYYATGSLANAPLIELIHFTAGAATVAHRAELFHTAITEICLNTPDIEAEHCRLKNLGVEFLSAPEEFDFSASGFGRSKAVYFRDPDGIILELMQNLPV